MKEFIERWKSELPEFWKKVRKLAVSLGSSALSVMAADKLFELQSYGVSPVVFTVCSYILVACAVLGVTAQLTKKDV